MLFLLNLLAAVSLLDVHVSASITRSLLLYDIRELNILISLYLMNVFAGELEE